MERPGSTPSPGRKNSNSLLLQELEALSQSLYKSQPPIRGGSLSTLPNANENEGIPFPGLANTRQEAFMSPKNKRHSIANPQSTEGVELFSAGLKTRYSASAASPFGYKVSESMDIRERRKRSSSPFRWRKGEARHGDDERKSWGYHDAGVIMEDDFERKLEESAEKSKGFWTWKPMRALSHIGLHCFTCVFSVYVNAIQGLSTSMNGLRLAVYLRKKETREGAVQTVPSRVYEGVAEFEETLHIKCHVYGGKHNSHGFKFQSKSFTISVIAVDAEELDLGRHHLDLSMLLHETERIQATGEECNGWNVNYELWGKARGAKLAVSLGYEILDKDGHGNKIGNISPRIKDSHPSRTDRGISKSLPNSTRGTPKMVPAGFSYENIDAPPYNQSGPGRDMFNFVKVEHLSLDDHEAIHSQMPQNWPQKSFGRKDGAESRPDTVITHSSQPGLNMDDAASHASHLQSLLQGSKFDALEEENQEEEGDFEVVEKGMEIQRPKEGTPAAAMDYVKQSDNKEEEGDQEEEEGGEIVKEMVQEDRQSKRLSELNSIFQQIDALESVILEKTSNELSLESVDQNPGNQAFEDVLKTKEDLSGAIKNNMNIDEEADLVEGEFLHMLEEEDDEKFGSKEAIHPAAKSIEDDMEFASILEAAETELQKATQSIESKRRATLLEDAETEALMQEWGLNEDVFQNSPSKADHPTGLATTQAKLPDLGEGLGCVVHTRDGGMLASMDPGQFRTGERLVMHVSKPVVVPAEMGDNTVEILQSMAGMGSASMATQAMASMPLDDITGKTLGKIAFEGMASAITNHGHPEQKVSSIAGSRKPKLAGLQTIENVTQKYVSLDSIAPLSVQKIEEMALEGLKIQAEMAEEEAPYTLPPVSLPKHGTLGQLLAAAADNDDAASNGPMSMAISLEEWSRLDAGLYRKGGEKETKEKRTRALLSGHRADKDKNNEQGHMGNALTIALLVQLRDPLRSYDAVGSPMMALVQAERLILASRSNINVEEDEEDQAKFKIKGVHLSGLKWNRDEKNAVWGTEKQCQTGSRWLLANGTAKNTKHSLLKSKLNTTQIEALKQGESIWSISSTSQKRSKNTIRNPDVGFPKRSIWRD